MNPKPVQQPNTSTMKSIKERTMEKRSNSGMKSQKKSPMRIRQFSARPTTAVTRETSSTYQVEQTTLSPIMSFLQSQSKMRSQFTNRPQTSTKPILIRDNSERLMRPMTSKPVLKKPKIRTEKVLVFSKPQEDESI